MADSPNVAVVRRAFDAFTLRDVERLVATCSPDVEFDLPTARLARTGQPYRGHEGVRTYMRDAARVWAELRLEAREFHEAGDLVVAVGRVYAWGEGRVVGHAVGLGVDAARRARAARDGLREPRRGVPRGGAGDRLRRSEPRGLPPRSGAMRREPAEPDRAAASRVGGSATFRRTGRGPPSSLEAYPALHRPYTSILTPSAAPLMSTL